MIEELRNELYQYIEKYGLNDHRTVRKSQELDRALNTAYGKGSICIA